MSNNENNEIKLEDLENYEDHGMRVKEIVKYQEEFKSKFGRNLDPDKDMVLIGEYSEIMFDENGNWTKFMLFGDDIGNGEFYFFLKDFGIYLDKGNLLLEDSYHDMVKTTINQFFNDSVKNVVDFRELK